ncbi:MAG TPA: MFS transporter [Candidatus Sulfotelmatobacter sp.]|nr:MFS transporter [Candidatus Sulfotelmatobacter sp.]
MLGTYRGLPKEATRIIYSLIVPSIAYGMLYTDISYFLTLQGLSDVTMGLIVMVMGISTFTASIPLGMVADRYGKKKMLILGNIAASVTIAVFALTTNVGILFIAAILEGVAEGASAAATSALLAEKCEAIQRNSVFSLFGFAQSMAFGAGGFTVLAVGVFQALSFNESESHVLLYVAVAIVSLASTALMLRITESKISKKPTTKTKFKIDSLFPKKSKDVIVKYVLTGATIAFGAGLFVPLMTRWMRLQYGVVDTLSSSVLAAASIAIAFATLASPYIAKRIGLIKAVVVTQSLSTLFMFLTPLSPGFFLASAIYSVRAFLMNMSSPLEQSMIMGLVSPDERGVASGISTALWRLPNALSSSIGAWMMGLGYLALPFFVGTIIYVISISMFWFFFKNTAMPEEIDECERQVDILRE